MIDHASHLLPAQGPITVFIHHNTLHAFEDLTFHEAVKKGGQVFGCHPYLAEDRYRDELQRGRIRYSELKEVLLQDMGDRRGEAVPCFGTREELRLAMLEYPLRSGPTEELVWYVAEERGLNRVRQETSSATRATLIAETRRWVMRDLRSGREQGGGVGPGRRASESLSELLSHFAESAVENWGDDEWEGFTVQAIWRVCCDGVRDQPAFTPAPEFPVRHRELLLLATGEDADSPVNDLLIPFCAAFLDQGFAKWRLPRRGEGFLRSFCALYGQPNGPPRGWMSGLAAELFAFQAEGVEPLESIRRSLDDLGVNEDEWDDFLSAALLSLRGWGGMIRQVELRGDRVVHPVPTGSLVEFLAVRLILDRYSLAFTAEHAMGFSGPLGDLRGLARGAIVTQWPPSVEQRAFLVFQLAQVFGLSPDNLYRLTPAEWARLLEEAEAFTSLERRRIFHLAYERRFYRQTLDALALHPPRRPPEGVRPRFQAMFCIDDREESLRRHIEELAPDVVTFGTAGFFSIAMYYRGATDAHFVPLCPVVIRPQHWVAEQVVETFEEVHRRRARTRRALGIARHRFHLGSRSFAAGAS